MSCNYCWNQPKRFGEYDLYLDGKIKADDFVYRVKNKETGKIESFSITEEFDTINERLKTHFTFDTSFKSYNELETAFNNGELKETVIYVVENEASSDNPDSKDNYNEYMIISVENEDGTIVKKLELIGSGSYTKQNIDILEEKNRAIERENEIEEVYSNITGYPFEKLNDSNLNIDNRIKKEIENRQISEAAISSVLADEIKKRKEEMKNKITVNTPITISKTNGTSTTTTSITETTVSTTTLTGTLDAESMKNSLTAEAVQSVVPIAWTDYSVTFGGASAHYEGSTIIGRGAKATWTYSTAMGYNASAGAWSASVGYGSYTAAQGVALGGESSVSEYYGVALGCKTKTQKTTGVTIGVEFTEATDSGDITHPCTTEGTGSITIGAGANTKNPLNPDNKTPYKNSDGEEVESSYSITIGQKAENYSPQNVVIGANAKATNSTKTVNGVEETVLTSNSVTIGYDANNTGADSVVIGAKASGTAGGSLAMGVYAKAEGSDCTAVGVGAEAKNAQTVAVGKGSKVSGSSATAVGARSSAKGMQALALGLGSSASGVRGVAIGSQCTSADTGAVVFRSSASDDIYTQLYFSGQNTPLALKYYPTEWEKKQDVDDQGNPKVDENGEPVMVDDKDKPTKGQAMMGYVVSKVITNEEGKKETKVLECGTNLLAALFPNHGLGDNPFQPTTTAIDGEIISFHPSDIDMPIEDTNVNVEEDYKSLPLSPIYPIVEPEIEEL